MAQSKSMYKKGGITPKQCHFHSFPGSFEHEFIQAGLMSNRRRSQTRFTDSTSGKCSCTELQSVICTD